MNETRGGRVVTWEALALHVAVLSCHSGYVLRMLFEALDVCRAGLDGVKSRLREMKRSQHYSDGGIKRDCEEGKHRCKMVSEKVGSSTVWTPGLGQQLPDEVAVSSRTGSRRSGPRSRTRPPNGWYGAFTRPT